MGGVHWNWTRDETIFAVFAMLIVAMSTFGIDRLLCRPKKTRRRSPDPRKYRVSYIIEEQKDFGDKNDEDNKNSEGN